MAAREKHTSAENQGFMAFIRRLFARKLAATTVVKPEVAQTRLEPKYWVEVTHFMDTIQGIVQKQTIEDNNLQILNQRIMDYIVQQINIKGSLPDVEQRYMALNILADRILVNNLSKIVGLKHSPTTQAEFTHAVEELKREFQKRHQAELLNPQRKH